MTNKSCRPRESTALSSALVSAGRLGWSRFRKAHAEPARDPRTPDRLRAVAGRCWLGLTFRGTVPAAVLARVLVPAHDRGSRERGDALSDGVVANW